MIIQKATDSETKRRAEVQIMKLMGSVKDVEDMLLLDDEIQSLLSKN